MNKAEIALYNELGRNDSYEVDNIAYSSGQQISKGIGTKVANVRGNPLYKAQFDIKIKQYMYDNTADVLIAPSDVISPARVDKPFTFLGLTDFNGGYARFSSLLPLNSPNWSYKGNYIVGREDGEAPSALTSSIKNLLKDGDMVFGYLYNVGGQAYNAAIVLSCSQVAYGTLLNSTSSDRFIINMIRYNIPDDTKTAQFNNQLKIINQSLFGKLSTDEISPDAFIQPSQFLKNYSDVPIIIGADKEKQIASYLNYDVDSINWTIFVSFVNKVKQGV